MSSEEAPQKAVLVLEYESPDPDLFFRVMEEISEALRGKDGCVPRLIHLAIRDPAQRVLDVFREEEEMALRKHGEGEVLPENEQQKTAQQSGGMSEADREALRAENEEADGVRDME